MNSEALSFKTTIKELDLLKETVITQWNVWIKNVLLLSTKLIEKIPNPSNAKWYYNSYLKRKKYKIGNTIRVNYLSIKSYRKSKHFWHKAIY